MWKALWLLLVVVCSVHARRHHHVRHEEQRSRDVMGDVLVDKQMQDDRIKQDFVMKILQGTLPRETKIKKDLKLIMDPAQYEGTLGTGMRFVLNELKNRQLLSTNEQFDTTNQIHLIQLNGLSRLMIQAKDWSILARILKTCSVQQINKTLLVKAIMLAMSERRDSQNIIIPNMPETLSDLRGRRVQGVQSLRTQNNWQMWKQQKETQIPRDVEMEDDILSSGNDRLLRMSPRRMKTIENQGLSVKKPWQQWKQEKEQTQLPLDIETEDEPRIVERPIMGLGENRLLRVSRRRMTPMERQEIIDNQQRMNMDIVTEGSLNMNSDRLLRMSPRRMKTEENLGIRKDTSGRKPWQQWKQEKEQTQIPLDNEREDESRIMGDNLLRISRRRMTPAERQAAIGVQRNIMETDDEPQIMDRPLSVAEGDRLLRISRRRMTPVDRQGTVGNQQRMLVDIEDDDDDDIMPLARKDSLETERISSDIDSDRLLRMSPRRMKTVGIQGIRQGSSGQKPWQQWKQDKEQRQIPVNIEGELEASLGSDEDRLLRVSRRRMTPVERQSTLIIEGEDEPQIWGRTASAGDGLMRTNRRRMNLEQNQPESETVEESRRLSSDIDNNRLLGIGRRRMTPMQKQGIMQQTVPLDMETQNIMSIMEPQNVETPNNNRLLHLGRRRMNTNENQRLVNLIMDTEDDSME